MIETRHLTDQKRRSISMPQDVPWHQGGEDEGEVEVGKEEVTTEFSRRFPTTDDSALESLLLQFVHLLLC